MTCPSASAFNRLDLRPRFRNSKLTLSGPQDAGKLAVLPCEAAVQRALGQLKDVDDRDLEPRGLQLRGEPQHPEVGRCRLVLGMGMRFASTVKTIKVEAKAAKALDKEPFKSVEC